MLNKYSELKRKSLRDTHNNNIFSKARLCKFNPKSFLHNQMMDVSISIISIKQRPNLQTISFEDFTFREYMSIIEQSETNHYGTLFDRR